MKILRRTLTEALAASGSTASPRKQPDMRRADNEAAAATHLKGRKPSINDNNSDRNDARLSRREFIGAGGGAVAAAILGPTAGRTVWAAPNNSSRAGRPPVDYVNPFIGTTAPGLRWMIFPGAAMPFGMVKLSPDNRAGTYPAAYEYKVPTLLGFSHIHSWTMGGLLMMPTSGRLKVIQGPESGSPESFRSC